MSHQIAANTAPNVLVFIQTEIGESYVNPTCKVHRFDTLFDLSADQLSKISPSIIVCPLFTLRYDAIDVGKLIQASAVKAKLLIEAPTLPRPAMVAKEINEECPGLNFDFFDIQRWLNRCLLTA